MGAEKPFRFMAVVEENRAAPGPAARFHIMQNIADHPRGGEIDSPVEGRLEQETGRGLTAVAGSRIERHAAFGMVGTEVKPVQPNLKILQAGSNRRFGQS